MTISKMTVSVPGIAEKLTKKELKSIADKCAGSLERQGFNMSVLKLEIGSKISDAIDAGRMQVEHRGHFGNGRYDIIRQIKDRILMPQCSLEDGRKLSRAFKRQGGLRTFVTLNGPSCLMECSVCGEGIALETDAKVIRPATTCKYPNGMVVKFKLNVPSGKIVCRDDLRGWFNYYGSFNINASVGIMLATLEMAKIGCAHGFVGNSCPGIYSQPDDTYIIANGAYTDEDWSDESYVSPRGERVAGICTDLWWYSLVDYDEFKRRAGKLEPDDVGAEVFDVKPGVYHFRHFHGELNHEEKKGEPYTYAEFKWVSKPEPIQDYLKETKSRDFTIGQIVHRSMKKYPDLYANSFEGIRGAVDHIFTVIGGGGEWHENGFVQYDPNMPADEPETAIPKFDTPQRWYGLSRGYSAVCAAAGVKNNYHNPDKIDHLNPSFLKVAFDIARNIYLFGAGNDRSNDEEQREIALECLKGLAERYPDNIPEDCKVLITPEKEISERKKR